MWIYLSPHFDDSVYSCGGLICQQAQAGQTVQIWTVCGGEIPPGPLTPFAQELHTRWGTGFASVERRREEDEAACLLVGAAGRHFNLPDCIYRRRLAPPGAPLVTREDDLWLPLPPGEAPLVELVAAWLRQGLARVATGRNQGKVRLVCPLGVGGHVDHRLVRAAAESLGCPLWYYADYPYAATEGFAPYQWLGLGWRIYTRRLSNEAIQAWQAGTEAYASQLSSFWPGPEEMRRSIADYAQLPPGHTLWRRSPANAADQQN